MDILNVLPEEQFAEVDDLLAFISIYDDRRRTEAYQRLLRAHRKQIEGKVCVDAGAGFGIFAEELARLGAGKVYAVEANPALFEIASKRLRKYANVELVRADIREFKPAEPVAVLVHEFFGQLLYDEDLHVLDELNFSPELFLPNGARLMAGCVWSSGFVDETVTKSVLAHLEGVLVSGLFEEKGLSLDIPVLEWSPGFTLLHTETDISPREGDLLYLGLQVLHNGEVICQAGECPNWSFAWTPRMGDRFVLEFQPTERGSEVYFRWVS